MNRESGKSYKEIKAILAVIIILAFIFGFNDNKSEFILKNWLLNLFYVFILASLVVLFNVLGYKLAAKYLDAEAEIKILNYNAFKEKFQFAKMHRYILTPVLPILITLFSNGKLFFTAISTFELKNQNVYGRKFPKLTYFNIGLIAVSGLFFIFVLIIFFKLLNLDKGVMIGAWFIIWNLLPFSDLPGAKIFFASRAMYLFSMVFFVLNILLLQFLSVLTAIIASFFFSIVFAMIYFYFVEYKMS